MLRRAVRGRGRRAGRLDRRLRRAHRQQQDGRAGERGRADPQPAPDAEPSRTIVVGRGEPDPTERVLLESRRQRPVEGQRAQHPIERCVGRLLAPAAFATLDVLRRAVRPGRATAHRRGPA